MSTHELGQSQNPSPVNGPANDARASVGHYTQEAINDGQRKINYKLHYSCKELVEVVEALKDAIKGKPGFESVDFGAIESAITEASEYTEAVPGIIPPGCDPG